MPLALQGFLNGDLENDFYFLHLFGLLGDSEIGLTF